ncbi:hypothetical protein [Candidatus Magnetobacterium casense]|uniref:Uncharacterized protein n=1 Tax=Candidatus Magnetobacterium casense TaxID=1455061 RepID=A0ABS6S167_9BACT|nr:hypothetical protein [Candidatus Magnetobacterium casensis]MBV6342143.1 hypothetical protein [Candidatus Magnetobacterium casensis]
MGDNFTSLSNDPVENALLSLAIEGWRFSRAFLRLTSKIEVSEQNRYVSQCRYFQKQIEEKVGEIGYKLVNIEGHPFEPGIAG